MRKWEMMIGESDGQIKVSLYYIYFLVWGSMIVRRGFAFVVRVEIIVVCMYVFLGSAGVCML